MLRILLSLMLVCCTFNTVSSQDTATATAQSAAKKSNAPEELAVLRGWVGVWDAEFWPAGAKEKMPIKGTETIRAFGTHWLASDFVTEMNGQSNTAHSIVGYDLNKKKLVGTLIDMGPYAAAMTGEFDAKTKSVTWTVKGQMPDGTAGEQRTVMTQESPDKRTLTVKKAPGAKKGEWKDAMKIVFVRRKKSDKTK